MKIITTILLLFPFAFQLSAQEKSLPYQEIPPYPDTYTAGNVVSRMIDGLGFRFHWATDGLRPEDLAFKPGDGTRTTEETIEHIYSMSFVLVNATAKTLNVSGRDRKLPFGEMRKKTLENFKAASEKLRSSSGEELKEYNAKFRQGDTTVELPFWNIINGPIADCLWHVGQVVSFRRSSGNPFSEKVDVFRGNVRE